MNDVWYIDPLHMTLRLVLAVVLGGLIGWEREYKNQHAGFRTHILVCVGSALIMLLSIYGFADFAYEYNVRMDPARLAAQVISGIGFLGAGTILRHGFSVSGLTTAASLWVVAAIGLSVGAGFYYAAALVTLLVLISLRILNKFEKKFMNVRFLKKLIIEMEDRPAVMNRVSEILEEKGANITKMQFDRNGEENAESGTVTWMLHLKPVPSRLMIDMANDIRQLQGVQRVSTE
jgi:putative Mg2+ transporter-C (MgtC) family protein